MQWHRKWGTGCNPFAMTRGGKPQHVVIDLEVANCCNKANISEVLKLSFPWSIPWHLV